VSGSHFIRFAAAFVLWLGAGLLPASAQIKIAQDGWEGFATAGSGGAIARCVLYNRAIKAINASPYDMLGVSRDKAGHVGLLAFFTPNSIQRAKLVPVIVTIDATRIAVSGEAISDFHIVIPGPLDSRAVGLMRQAKVVEISAQRHNERFVVDGALAGVLDRLKTCAAETLPAPSGNTTPQDTAPKDTAPQNVAPQEATPKDKPAGAGQ
jgi:hypothetical protein